MEMFMSFMGKGEPSSQMINFAIRTFYNHFVEKDIKNFEEFHIAILDIFDTINSGIPGKHYDVPTLNEVEKCFDEWKQKPKSRKESFVRFMRKSINRSKLDDSTTAMVTGLLTPPVAMVAKKAGEEMPQLKVIKVIPDVIFVPSATALALVSSKLTKRTVLGSLAS